MPPPPKKTCQCHSQDLWDSARAQHVPVPQVLNCSLSLRSLFMSIVMLFRVNIQDTRGHSTN